MTVAGPQISNLSELYETHLGVEIGTFVEVGAFNGQHWSNTYALARRGWKGIAIEPHPTYFGQLIETHEDLDVTCINVAIGDHNGVAELYLAGSLSTIVESQVETYRGVGWSGYLFPPDVKKYEVRVRTLNHVLSHHKPMWESHFDLLVIDVEGSELDVLRGFNIEQWRPTMMIIETYEENPDRSLNWKAGVIGTMLDFYGYENIQSDTINTIYVRKGV
jgi:FkbM family methyltransferase